MPGCSSKPFVTGYRIEDGRRKTEDREQRTENRGQRQRTQDRQSSKMYQTILIPVENRETDNTILEHIRQLARLTKAKLLLVHVADGWVARNYEQLKLQESEEMR